MNPIRFAIGDSKNFSGHVMFLGTKISHEPLRVRTLFQLSFSQGQDDETVVRSAVKDVCGHQVQWLDNLEAIATIALVRPLDYPSAFTRSIARKLKKAIKQHEQVWMDKNWLYDQDEGHTPQTFYQGELEYDILKTFVCFDAKVVDGDGRCEGLYDWSYEECETTRPITLNGIIYPKGTMIRTEWEGYQSYDYEIVTESASITIG